MTIENEDPAQGRHPLAGPNDLKSSGQRHFEREHSEDTRRFQLGSALAVARPARRRGRWTRPVLAFRSCRKSSPVCATWPLARPRLSRSLDPATSGAVRERSSSQRGSDAIEHSQAAGNWQPHVEGRRGRGARPQRLSLFGPQRSGVRLDVGARAVGPASTQVRHRRWRGVAPPGNGSHVRWAPLRGRAGRMHRRQQVQDWQHSKCVRRLKLNDRRSAPSAVDGRASRDLQYERPPSAQPGCSFFDCLPLSQRIHLGEGTERQPLGRARGDVFASRQGEIDASR
jgi:hypothetical protein